VPREQTGEIRSHVLITGGLLACRGMALAVHYLVVRWGNSPTEADRVDVSEVAPRPCGDPTASVGMAWGML
jgi:hypothetical protein